MSLYRFRILYVQIHKAVNKLNPEFYKQYVKAKENKRLVREQHKLNLEFTEWNQVTFGTTCLNVQRPKIWNSSTFHIKSFGNLNICNGLMKNWNGNSSSGTICTK